MTRKSSGCYVVSAGSALANALPSERASLQELIKLDSSSYVPVELHVHEGDGNAHAIDLADTKLVLAQFLYKSDLATPRHSGVYMISVESLVSNRVELTRRSRDNAYSSHREHRNKSPDERARIYDDFKQKIEVEGFIRDYPIELHLNRKRGSEERDRIGRRGGGHHRLAIAVVDGVPKLWRGAAQSCGAGLVRVS